MLDTVESIQVFDGTGPVYATTEQWDNAIRNYCEAIDGAKAESLNLGLVTVLASKFDLLMRNTFPNASDLRVFKLRAEQREMLINDMISHASVAGDTVALISKLHVCRAVCVFAQRAELPTV